VGKPVKHSLPDIFTLVCIADGITDCNVSRASHGGCIDAYYCTPNQKHHDGFPLTGFTSDLPP